MTDGRDKVVDECMLLFGCSSVLTVVTKRKAKFLDDYLQSYNILCRLFVMLMWLIRKRGTVMLH